MFTVALTGGIASGKSSAAGYFAKRGITVIDADQIARKLINTSEILSQVVEYFGPSILKNKELDRTKLRSRIFSDKEARDYLEQLLHPLIYREIQASILLAESVYCLVVIPLLFEEKTAVLLKEKQASRTAIELNRTLLVTTSKELQTRRARERDQLEQKQIDSILSIQISSAESLGKADDIIYNVTTLDNLYQSVERFHQMYLSFSHSNHIVLEQSAFLSYYFIPKQE
ncbi:MAG: dephospho-CoA kinase [Pseudomonadota bacterium]